MSVRSHPAAVILGSSDAGDWRRLLAEASADAECKGLAVFVAGLNWFGVRWGLRRATAGLRDAGFGGTMVYWQWHSRPEGMFGVPAYLYRARFEPEGRAVAEFITAWRREHPDGPIYLLGCSAGGYIALRALELLGDGVCVTSAAMISAAFAPACDLRGALARVAGPMVISSSWLDWLVLGLGTSVLGTSDGRHTPAVGMVGLASVPGRRGDRPAGKIVQVRWRPSMILSGRFGGHASAVPRRYIAKYIAPAMGIAPTGAAVPSAC